MDPLKSYMRLDKYTSRICIPAVSRFCLRSNMYRPIFNGISYKVYKLFPLQHMFGDIDILNKKLKNKDVNVLKQFVLYKDCLLYTSPSPRDRQKSRMPSSA